MAIMGKTGLSDVAVAASKKANKSGKPEDHAAAQHAHIAARAAAPKGSKFYSYHVRAIEWHAIAYAKASAGSE